MIYATVGRHDIVDGRLLITEGHAINEGSEGGQMEREGAGLSCHRERVRMNYRKDGAGAHNRQLPLSGSWEMSAEDFGGHEGQGQRGQDIGR